MGWYATTYHVYCLKKKYTLHNTEQKIIEFPIIKDSQGGQKKHISVKPRRGNVGNLGQAETTPRLLII